MMINKKKYIAAGEVFLLVGFVFAVAMIFGESVGVVSGEIPTYDVGGSGTLPYSDLDKVLSQRAASMAKTPVSSTLSGGDVYGPTISGLTRDYTDVAGYRPPGVPAPDSFNSWFAPGELGTGDPTIGTGLGQTPFGAEAAKAAATGGADASAILSGTAHQFGMQGGTVANGFMFEGGTLGITPSGMIEWSAASNSWISSSQAIPNGWAIQQVGLADGSVVTAVVSPDKITAMTSKGAIGWNPTAGIAGTGAWTGVSSGFHSYAPFGIKSLTIGGSSAVGGMVAHLAQGLVWAGVVVGIIQLAGALFDLDQNLVDSLSWSAFGGIMTYKGLLAFGSVPGQAGLGLIPAGSPLLTFAPLIGIGVGVAIFIATYKKEKQELVVFECQSWEAPTGGANCEKCNEDPLMPCSEYRCRSLGQACAIVNEGTDQEMCVWLHKEDVQAPKINPWDEALKPEGLQYVPDSSVSPPNRGFKITKPGAAGGCLQAFSRLEFGIEADEPAQCKVDYRLTDRYSDMTYAFGEGGNATLFLEHHREKLKVPSPFTEEGDANFVPEIHDDGTYTLWVRCIDANGNGEDAAAVGFRFCVEPGPDVRFPIIEGTSIENGQPVQHNASRVPIEVYVNEPAECKWSHEDKTFDLMENEMNCASRTYEINAQLNYVCSGELTGIKDRQENNFYFRCMDYSTAAGGRNVMTTSHHLMLRGTEPLVIDSVGPTGIISGSTDIVDVDLTVETSHGADEGSSICYFTSTPENDASFSPMEGELNYFHNQTIYRPRGTYTYYFKCVDDGGNTVFANTTFSVEVDTEWPEVTRVYRDGSTLKVITDEKAKCYYSLTNCNYNLVDGLPMTYADSVQRNVHYVDWDVSVTYYIKCEDLRGKQPPPNECQIVVRGSEF